VIEHRGAVAVTFSGTAMHDGEHSPTLRLPWFLGAVSTALWVAATTACGAGKVDAGAPMKGRAEMLSKTQIAQKCEEAARGHDKPFVVEWDATDLASFEARARMDTVFVRYEGCRIEVLYQCNDPMIRGRIGRYAEPIWTSGTVQALDVKSEVELYSKLPLGAASLSANIERGESLHLKYFVAGVVQNTREFIYEGDLRPYAGCSGATHFVWAYNLGAFELGTASKQGAGAEGEVVGYGAGGKVADESSTVSNGGSIASCSTNDQRACHVPIRLALRKINAGDDPKGSLPPSAGVPGGPGGPPLGALPPDVSDTMTANAAYQTAQQKSVERDGVACLAAWDRAASISAKVVEPSYARRTHAICLMLAGRCDEGSKEYRALLASDDVRRAKDDEELDKETREQANRTCPASTAKNDADYVMRAENEMSFLWKTGDAKSCTAIADAVEARYAGLDRKDPFANNAHSRVPQIIDLAAYCVARNKKCIDGLPLWKRAYRLKLRGMKDSDKYATESWATMTKQRDKKSSLQCTE
jgi:hypothetical protein